MKRILIFILGCFAILAFPLQSLAANSDAGPLNLHMTSSGLGLLALTIFVAAYTIVMAEEFLHLRKSKPVMLAAGLIWILVAILAQGVNVSAEAESAIRHNLLEYGELLLFLLVAMTYVNAMEERGIFEALRGWLVRTGFSYRQLFWITGVLAFFISPIADNLTTALVMCAVVMAVGGDNKRFVSIGCINIVVSANAGGAFSPFGDITTLMVWQAGVLSFFKFFQIFIPSVVSYVVPAIFMHFAIPKVSPPPKEDSVLLKFGAKRVLLLFVFTIATAVSFHNFLHLPPCVGMMTGLAYLQFFGFYTRKMATRMSRRKDDHGIEPFDVFRKVERAEWDTLLFFYGVILCVGGLSVIGYLSVLSQSMYNDWGQMLHLSTAMNATPANSAVGVLSAIVDNIPVMFAVLTMNPHMPEGQWLLVTLTAGVGGSLLSVGSAAGVALMGQAKGMYTFFSHLRWTWAIAIGYVLAILCHLWINAHTFHIPV